MLVVAALAAGQRGAQALQPEEGHLINHFRTIHQVRLLSLFYTGTAISRSSPSGIFWPNWTSGSWYLAVSSDFRRTILLVYFLGRRRRRTILTQIFEKGSGGTFLGGMTVIQAFFNIGRRKN